MSVEKHLAYYGTAAAVGGVWFKMSYPNSAIQTQFGALPPWAVGAGISAAAAGISSFVDGLILPQLSHDARIRTMEGSVLGLATGAGSFIAGEYVLNPAMVVGAHANIKNAAAAGAVSRLVTDYVYKGLTVPALAGSDYSNDMFGK